MASRKLWLSGSILFLFFIFVILAVLEDTADVSEKKAETYHPPVSVVDAKPGKYRGILRSFAEIKPRWSAELKAHISGEIVEILPQAMEGETVKKGDLLIRIEDSRYMADLDRAEYNLAQAQLTFQQEEKKTRRALSNWKRSGIKQRPSDMALNKPQQELAQRGVDAARSAVQAARQDLSYTKIKATFSGIVSKRYVSIGQTVNPGDQLIQLLEDSTMDIKLSLSPRQWSNMDPAWKGKKVPVKNDDGKQIAVAQIKRGGGFLDPQTRQYKLFLQITGTDDAEALPGEFVYIELPGREVSGTAIVPESALTREGLIWYVDAQNRLRSFDSDVLFYQGNNLVVSIPEELAKSQSIAVIVNPLASFIAGREVAPVRAEGS